MSRRSFAKYRQATIYADGCWSAANHAGGWGFVAVLAVIRGGDVVCMEQCGGMNIDSNTGSPDVMEAWAIHWAADFAKPHHETIIINDSLGVVRKLNSRRRYSGRGADVFERTRELLQRKGIKLEWRGRNSTKAHERADALSRRGRNIAKADRLSYLAKQAMLAARSG